MHFCFLSGSHAMDLTLQSTLFGFRKPKQVIALSTDDAFTKGTKILGETLVYVISASILLYEYHKSQIKDYDKTIKIDTILRAMHFQEEKIDMIQKDIHSYEDEIKKIKRDINLYEEDKSQIQNDIHLYEEKLAQLQKDIFLLKRKLRPKLII